MQTLSYILIALFGLQAAHHVSGDGSTISQSDDDTAVESDWQAFKQKFNRNYVGAEDQQRKDIFARNRKLIKENNRKFEAGEVTSTMELNNFADQLPEELAHLHGAKVPQNVALSNNQLLQNGPGTPLNESASTSASSPDLEKDWQDFKQKFGKTYSSSEDAKRKEIFAENRRKITEQNRNPQSLSQLELNRLSDLFPEELAALHGAVPPSGLGNNSVVAPGPSPANNIRLVNKEGAPNGVESNLPGFFLSIFGLILALLLH